MGNDFFPKLKSCRSRSRRTSTLLEAMESNFDKFDRGGERWIVAFP